jgi:hypothetical protein
MGIKHDSPLKTYPGYVILPDVIGWDEAAAYDDLMAKANEEGITLSHMAAYQSQAILAVVEEWHIPRLGEGKPEKLPASIAGIKLVGWLIGLITARINEDESADPCVSGASGNTSTTQSA